MSFQFWKAKNQKNLRVHQIRERRAQFGELVQIDGSPHAWFEDRGEKCTLLVIVDDATSAILDLHFCKAETTQDYFSLMESYFKHYGLPMSLYTDKHSVFRVNSPAHEETRLTQFGQAMKDLGVELIFASSPQAKGRVERANSTLQDRLVKMMRLDGICTIEEANAYKDGFIKDYNKKFAKPPKNKDNAHCAIGDNDALEYILCIKTSKRLSSSLAFQHNLSLYQIQADTKYRLQNKKVILCERYDGTSFILHQGKSLLFEQRVIEKKTREVHDEKTVNAPARNYPSTLDNNIALRFNC